MAPKKMKQGRKKMLATVFLCRTLKRERGGRERESKREGARERERGEREREMM